MNYHQTLKIQYKLQKSDILIEQIGSDHAPIVLKLK